MFTMRQGSEILLKHLESSGTCKARQQLRADNLTRKIKNFLMPLLLHLLTYTYLTLPYEKLNKMLLLGKPTCALLKCTFMHF